ncbi:MAG: hypothetical protein D6795_03710, partial [Deltaproteobacteria bacterium]
EIVDPENEDSPLAKLSAMLEETQHPIDRKKIRAVIQEARLFGCLMKSFCRDERDRIQDAILAIVERGGKCDEIIDETTAFLGDVEVLLRRFREIRRRYLDRGRESSDPSIREVCNTLDAVDEFISKILEKNLSEMLHTAQHALPPRCMRVMLERIEEKILSEQAYRKEENFPFPCIEFTGDHEQYLYRIRFLKQYISNVLYLNIRQIEAQRRVQSFIAAIFAGLAAAFATLVAIVASRRYPFTSVPFVAIGVAAYILKDRLKDWGKSTFTHSVMRYLPDMNHRIIDRTQEEEGESLGHCQESMCYLETDRIPEEIVAIRQIRRYTQKEREDWEQPVIHYRKRTHLFAKKILRSHKRRVNINDIIRLNVAHLLPRMDDAEVPLYTIAPEGGRIVTLKASKVYYLNIVFTYTTRKKRKRRLLLDGTETETKYEKIRIVLTKEGIKRIDIVVPPTPPAEIMAELQGDEEIWSISNRWED